MKVQAHIGHRRQQGARSLTKMLAFAMLALHAAQLTVPHVANAVQLVTTGTPDTETDSDEESSLAGKKTDTQSEVQALNSGRPRSLPARSSHDRVSADAQSPRQLHIASLTSPAQTHLSLPHRDAQLVRLII